MPSTLKLPIIACIARKMTRANSSVCTRSRSAAPTPDGGGGDGGGGDGGGCVCNPGGARGGGGVCNRSAGAGFTVFSDTLPFPKEMTHDSLEAAPVLSQYC